MKKSCLLLLLFKISTPWALTTTIYSTENPRQVLGTITFKNTNKGLEIQPQLHGLTPGPHGFHIHRVPSCQDRGQAADGHFDPNDTNKHLGPYQAGHLGDLPKLVVNTSGIANTLRIAPHLDLKLIQNHAVIIHQGGDNYLDTPAPLGGGGARVACGVIR